MSFSMTLPLRGRAIADTCVSVGYAHNQEKPTTPS
jgi:hypothetical protein